METKTTAKQGLKANFVYNFIGQILVLLVPLITTPYLARVLHETGNGQISYAASIISYFTLFSSLGFDTYGQRKVAAHQDDKDLKSKVFWEITLLKCVSTAIALVVFVAVFFSVGFGERYNTLILILSVQIIAIPFDIQFLFRGDEDFRIIAIRSIIIKLVGLVCIFLFVKEESDTWVYALCLSVSTLGANLTMWPAAVRRIKFANYGKICLKPHLKPAILIFLPILATTIYSVFDKTMIGLMAQNPDYENGCYDQAYKLNSVALLLVTLISSVMMSRNSHDYQTNDFESLRRHLHASARYVWMMGIPLIVGFSVMSANLTSWYLGDGYSEVPILLQIMSVRFIASGLGELLGTQFFFAIGKEKFPCIAAFTGAALNVLLNSFLIPRYGALGAAIATAICEVSVTVLLAVFAYRFHYMSYGVILRSCWKYVVSALVMFVPIYFMQNWLGNGIWYFIAITLTGIIVYALMLFALRDAFFLQNVKGFLRLAQNKIRRKSAAATEAVNIRSEDGEGERNEPTDDEAEETCGKTEDEKNG